MTKQVLVILLAIIGAAIILTIVFIIKNNKKEALKAEVEKLNVTFNTIRTNPLPFKLKKAQAMAKRSPETTEKIQGYYDRYAEVEKKISQITESIEQIEDDIAGNNLRRAKDTIASIQGVIIECEQEAANIDKFLDIFSKKENEQRDYSAKLKEEYVDIKNKINKSSNHLAIAYDGLCRKLEKCEELFSKSEEWMYANDYEQAQDNLSEIAKRIIDIKKCYEVIPDFVKDTKGVIPVLYDEVVRQYSLCKQQGVFTDHLNADVRLEKIQGDLNKCSRTLMDGEYNGLKELTDSIKAELSQLTKEIEDESRSNSDAKAIFEGIKSNLTNTKSVYSYVDSLYTTENERFDMNEVGECLKRIKVDMAENQATSITLNSDLTNGVKPSSVLKKDLEDLFNKTQADLDVLTNYKNIIDKNTNDEERAKTQLIKLQVVLNEVEVKVLEYHLPTIASNYKDDLNAGRERIAKIKEILDQSPLNVELLNTTLDEAIEFIYAFYNNVNNIVGMAIMVENAIVFGNKYRSSYNTVDRDLSKSEFSYLNGEYTKALRMAIESMETLFPNNANEKILENN